MASTSSNPLPTEPSMPKRNASFEEHWNFHKTGIDYVMGVEPGSKIPSSYFTRLYTTVYNCLTPMGVMDRDLGERLYAELARYFARHIVSIKLKLSNLQGTDLLRTYVLEWVQFTFSSNYLNQVSMYLNRCWVKAEQDRGSSKEIVYQVHALALVQWRENIVRAIHEDDQRLTTAIIELVIQHPSNESAEGLLVTKVLDSFVALGFRETLAEKVNLRVYKKHFEEPFLEALGLALRGSSSSATSSQSITSELASKYLEWAKARFENDESLGQSYLHPSTEKHLELALRSPVAG
ncbi:Cullin repeat-containing protein [Pluteus cervinus]|uniref:Cullin repeat-containing protein n=1 Tax=Pluteus cervinus TaxID=181527 RepID=A0ACD3AG03_9AGAR|nr:Cullin repeat-containing protein [Pluteus cervinus]